MKVHSRLLPCPLPPPAHLNMVIVASRAHELEPVCLNTRGRAGWGEEEDNLLGISSSPPPPGVLRPHIPAIVPPILSGDSQKERLQIKELRV